jgi:hypothetical protein
MDANIYKAAIDQVLFEFIERCIGKSCDGNRDATACS